MLMFKLNCTDLPSHILQGNLAGPKSPSVTQMISFSMPKMLILKQKQKSDRLEAFRKNYEAQDKLFTPFYSNCSAQFQWFLRYRSLNCFVSVHYSLWAKCLFVCLFFLIAVNWNIA